MFEGSEITGKATVIYIVAGENDMTLYVYDYGRRKTESFLIDKKYFDEDRFQVGFSYNGFRVAQKVPGNMSRLDKLPEILTVPQSISLVIESEEGLHSVSLFNPGDPPGSKPIEMPKNFFKGDYTGSRKIVFRVVIRNPDGTTVPIESIPIRVRHDDLNKLKVELSSCGVLMIRVGDKIMGSVPLGDYLQGADDPVLPDSKTKDDLQDSTEKTDGGQENFFTTSSNPPDNAGSQGIDTEDDFIDVESESIYERLPGGTPPLPESRRIAESQEGGGGVPANAPLDLLKLNLQAMLAMKERLKEVQKEIKALTALQTKMARLEAVNIIIQNAPVMAGEMMRAARLAGHNVDIDQYKAMLKQSFMSVTSIAYNSLSDKAQPIRSSRIDEIIENMTSCFQGNQGEKERKGPEARNQAPGA
mgnify:CR=1 FL=1